MLFQVENFVPLKFKSTESVISCLLSRTCGLNLSGIDSEQDMDPGINERLVRLINLLTKAFEQAIHGLDSQEVDKAPNSING